LTHAISLHGLLLIAAAGMAVGGSVMAAAAETPFARPTIDLTVPARTERAVFALG
jgi:hypothetical protein